MGSARTDAMSGGSIGPIVDMSMPAVSSERRGTGCVSQKACAASASAFDVSAFLLCAAARPSRTSRSAVESWAMYAETRGLGSLVLRLWR